MLPPGSGKRRSCSGLPTSQNSVERSGEVMSTAVQDFTINYDLTAETKLLGSLLLSRTTLSA